MKKQYYLAALTLLSLSNFMPAMDNKEKKATPKVALLAKGKIGIALKKKMLKERKANKQQTSLVQTPSVIAEAMVTATILNNSVASLLETAPAPQKPHHPKTSKQSWQKTPHVKSQQNKAVHQPR